jgi:hypothetical protein
LLAIERVDAKKQQMRLSKDQLDQLKERRRTEEAATESAFRELYTSVWLPRVEAGGLGIEKIDKGGRPLQATGIHERIMELLTSQGVPKVHASVTPQKIMERLKLGEPVAEGEPPRLGVKTAEVQDAFFSFLDPPRLDSGAALRKAIVRGVTEKVFAYTSGSVPSLGSDHKFQVSREKVAFGPPLAEDEVDLESGFLMVPSAIPEVPVTVLSGAPGLEGSQPPVVSVGPEAPATPGPVKGLQRVVRLIFSATRDQVFKAFPAIANLADKSDGGKVTIHVEATSQVGFDPSWLRNAVEEPLDEADIERQG